METVQIIRPIGRSWQIETARQAAQDIQVLTELARCSLPGLDAETLEPIELLLGVIHERATCARDTLAALGNDGGGPDT